VDRVGTDVGSALDGDLRKFLALLGDLEVTTIVVERRDRFARFGAEGSRSCTKDVRRVTSAGPLLADSVR